MTEMHNKPEGLAPRPPLLYKVEDQYSHWEYRILRRKWLEILKGEDRHSVYFQLLRLLDDNTKWRMVNEVRRLQSHNARSLHSMLDEWFWERQALGIRRITEQDDSKSRRSVYSLHRIIEEMIDKRSLITRANYMNNVERSDEAWIREDNEANFDRISSSQNRKPDDCVSLDYLKNLRKRITAKIFEEITVYANKFVAHSSDPQTRKSYEYSLKTLDEAYKALAAVIRDMAATFSDTHLEFEITRSEPITAGWDSVFASTDVIDQVQELERERRRIIESWGT